MGKVTDSLLSGTSGRTGRIVVSNVHGHEISRIRPKRGNRTTTPKQQLIKDRFMFAINFIQGYKQIVKEYYGKRNGLKSPYNMAMSNLLKAISLDVDNLTFNLNPTQVAFTKGTLLPPQPLGIASNNPNEFTINWDNNANTTEQEEDVLYIMLAEGTPQSLTTTVFQTAVTRAEETITVQLLPMYQGMELHVWISFVNPIEKIASNSTYIGTVTIS